MMKCKLEKAKIISYLFNELSSDESCEIMKHIDSCRTCQSELGQLKSTINFYDSQRQIEPPILKIITTPRHRNFARQSWTRKKARRLIPAFGLVGLLVIVTISFLWFFKPDKNSSYWSLENSWEGPYRYQFERIDRTVETIMNDEFFN